MILVPKKSLNAKEKAQVYQLWNNEYPESLSMPLLQEFNNYLDSVSDHHHILIKDGEGFVKGWYFDFIRDGKRWFATILHQDLQGKGYGSKLLELAKKKRKELHGWIIVENQLKVSGEAYQSPLEFYRKNEFTILKDVLLVKENFSAIKIEWRSTASVKDRDAK